MSKSLGILVFTNEKILEHKKRDGKQSDNNWCFWEMNRFPKRFIEANDEELRLYMAIKGEVKGYFVIHDLDYEGNPSDGGTLDFYSDSWKEVKGGEQLKPSQGYRYYLHNGG